MNPEIATVLAYVLKYGQSSTSFLSLYPGFKYFTHVSNGNSTIIAYIETLTAWIGASEPLGEASTQLGAIIDFVNTAKKLGKTAILLPVSQHLAEQARNAGLGTIEIGKEPWFKLTEFQKPNLAKQLEAKGARTESFNPAQITARERLELESVTQNWLGARKSAPLAFLNQVRPWIQMQQKQYFRVVYKGHQCGYLAAVPVPKRNAWYLIDLIRSPSAPLGTTELLINHAVNEFSQQGFETMTLGMSPLATVSSPERAAHPFIYAVFRLIYSRLNLFYNFRSLFQFKEKLKPTSWEPLYLISSGPYPGPFTMIGLFHAVYPAGFIKTILLSLNRCLRSILRFPEQTRILSNKLVFRSKPGNWIAYCTRMKVTLALFVTNVLFFISSTNENFTLRKAASERLGFQIQKILNGIDAEDIRALFLHSFFHWDLTHLAFNMICLIIFVGFLEIIVGSTFTLIAYVSGILFSNPLISLILVPLLRAFNHPLAEKLLNEEDVGCSLGVFAGIGALAYFLKNKKGFLSLFMIGTIIVSISTSSVLAFNHFAALAIGYAFSHYYLKRHER